MHCAQFVFIIGGITVDFLRMRCVVAALCGILLLTQVIITNSQESGKFTSLYMNAEEILTFKIVFPETFCKSNLLLIIALMSLSHDIQLQLFYFNHYIWDFSL